MASGRDVTLKLHCIIPCHLPSHTAWLTRRQRGQACCVIKLRYALAHMNCLPATQNEAAIKIIRGGMLIASVLSILLRLLFRRSSLTSISSIIIYAVTFAPTFFLSRYLTYIGKPKRDATGNLVSSGEDLSQPGLTEYAFDVIYVTCTSAIVHESCRKLTPFSAGACQIGSGIFGDRFWWFYLIVGSVHDVSVLALMSLIRFLDSLPSSCGDPLSRQWSWVDAQRLLSQPPRVSRRKTQVNVRRS
jgi:hypothetical protein